MTIPAAIGAVDFVPNNVAQALFYDMVSHDFSPLS
jgi:hypothetical protein